MSNKIGNIQTAAVTPAASPAVSGDRKGAAPAKVAKAGGEASATVQISATASMLSQAADDPTFDSAKVERIAQAIKDGKFSVNHGAIADKLIANAQELLGRTGTSH